MRSEARCTLRTIAVETTTAAIGAAVVAWELLGRELWSSTCDRGPQWPAVVIGLALVGVLPIDAIYAALRVTSGTAGAPDAASSHGSPPSSPPSP